MPNKPKTLRTGPPVFFDPVAETAQSLRFDPVPESRRQDQWNQERMERDRRSAERASAGLAAAPVVGEGLSRSHRAEREQGLRRAERRDFGEAPPRLEMREWDFKRMPSRSNRAEREQGLPQTEAEIEEYNRKVRLWNQQNPNSKYKKQELFGPPGRDLRRLDHLPPLTREAAGEMEAERAAEIERLRNAIEIGKQGLQRNPNNAELLRRVKEGEMRLQELQSQGMNQTLQEAMPINPGQTIR